MSHKRLKTRENQLRHMLCKVDRIWMSIYDRDGYQKIRKELELEIEEWYQYWHKKETS